MSTEKITVRIDNKDRELDVTTWDMYLDACAERRRVHLDGPVPAHQHRARVEAYEHDTSGECVVSIVLYCCSDADERTDCAGCGSDICWGCEAWPVGTMVPRMSATGDALAALRRTAQERGARNGCGADGARAIDSAVERALGAL